MRGDLPLDYNATSWELTIHFDALGVNEHVGRGHGFRHVREYRNNKCRRK